MAAVSEITAAIAMAQRQVDDVSSVPTSDSLTARRLADRWDTWKIRIRQILLTTTKKARQGLTKRYRQRLHRLYVRMGEALLEARSYDDSQVSAQRGCDHLGPVDTPEELRKNFSECRRLWQRTKKERTLVHHIYFPDETSRRFYARVATKF